MTIEYSALADLWDESGCYQTPSALHGWLSGYLASGGRLTGDAWQQEAMDYLEIDELSDALKGVLAALYTAVLKQMQAEDMSFTLLLPDDEEADIDEQVDCLAQWSKGFLDGLGASGKISGRPDADVLEVLQDLDAFSQAQIDDVNDPENTQLYLELAEHARVAALTVFYAFNQPAPKAPETLH